MPRLRRVRSARRFQKLLKNLQHLNDLKDEDFYPTIPRNTFNEAFNKKTVPTSDFVTRFVGVCKVSDEQRQQWLTVRDQAREWQRKSLLRRLLWPARRPAFPVLRSRRLAAIAGVAVLVVVGGLYLLGDHLQQQRQQQRERIRAAADHDKRARHCGTTDPGLTFLADRGECVGISADGYLFNDPATADNDTDRRAIDNINTLQRQIMAENQKLSPADPYVKIVLVNPLTVSRTGPSVVSLQAVQHDLEGAYTALLRINETRDYGDPTALKVQLLLANVGSQEEVPASFVPSVLALSQPRHPVVAAVGLGISVPATLVLTHTFADDKIPMVNASLSADDFDTVPGLWSISSSNTEFAQAIRSFLDHQHSKTLSSGMIFFDNNEDLFTKGLKQAYEKQLGPYLKAPAQPFKGGATTHTSAANVFDAGVTNMCSVVYDPDHPLNMVFFAGRVADFHDFADALRTRTCKDRPLAVLVGSATMAAAQQYVKTLEDGNVTLIYVGASNPLAWAQDPTLRPPDYPAFLTAYQNNHFNPGNLTDGHAISQHDAFVTAARAARLAAQATPVPTPQDVAAQFGHLNLAYTIRGATGRLSFPPDGGRSTGRTLTLNQIGTTTTIHLPANLPPYLIPTLP
jgi:hypothetical protein